MRSSPAARVTLLALAIVALAGARAPASADELAVRSRPSPYSLPWQLRPAGAITVVRADTSMASYGASDQTGYAAATLLLASWKITPTLAPVARVGLIYDDQPGVAASAALVNPLVGLTWAPRLAAPWRLAVFGGVALPVGMGGADDPRMDATAAAVARGVPLRSAMDNAMFAVNYTTPLAGVDLAYTRHGLTLQAEATLLQLVRARHPAFAPEAARSNATFGVHAGYFVAPTVSLGADVRYQRWLTTPAFVAANPAARDTLTVAVGPRFHVRVGDATWIRPGVSYTWAVDDPLAGDRYRIVQVDVPIAF